MQYLPSIEPTAAAAASGTFGTSSHSQFDLFGRYQINDMFELRDGVDNLFNASPEITGATAANANRTSTFPGHDLIGRAYYVGLKVRM
jgi:iron complex outermembrane recepter protein